MMVASNLVRKRLEDMEWYWSTRLRSVHRVLGNELQKVKETIGNWSFAQPPRTHCTLGTSKAILGVTCPYTKHS